MTYLAEWLTVPFSILLVAVGIGLVIFVHELGHFAVAKWVGVIVERFSIGFGPVLWSFRRGGTQYALSAIPFGGYVRMLGENPDDSDSDNPRAYSNQSVPKRMTIISAGVVMNILFGFVCFLFVFNVGMRYTPAVIGYVAPGSPAWRAGLERGDLIKATDGQELIEFESLQLAVMLAKLGDDGIELEVERGGKQRTLVVVPRLREMGPQIGVMGPLDLKVAEEMPVFPGTAAASTEGEWLQAGDRITHVDGRKVSGHPEFADYLARHAADAVRVGVRRAAGEGGEATLEVTIGPQYFRDLGLRLDMPKITAVQKGSPAALATTDDGKDMPLAVGDKIKGINGEPFDPLRLPDLLAELAAGGRGEGVRIEIRRQLQGVQGEQDLQLVVDLENLPGWITPPLRADDPFSAPALGVAYQVFTDVTEEPDPESPARGAGLQKGDLITGAVLELPGEEPLEIPISDESPGFPYLFWKLQTFPQAQVKLQIKKRGDDPPITTTAFSPEFDPNWPAPFRGIHLTRLSAELPPQGLMGSVRLGYKSTFDTLAKIYLTLRRLIINRSVSAKALSGPVMIAVVGYYEASVSVSDLIRFLAILSINLAVINFLPIPILDGGHMVFLVWEGIWGKRASERVLIAANYCGLVLIITLALYVTFQDVWRLRNIIGG